MKDIKYIVGDENTLNTPLRAFDDEVCEFLGTLSKMILKNENSKKFSDLATLGFYLRKANIDKISEQYDKNLLGRGLCFHIAPSNVPLNFAFSFVFGLLAGCANIVRLPSKDYEQIEIFCDLAQEILPKFQKIQARTAFVKYERNDEITAEFSKISDARMIWGGDDSIKHIKSFETMPRCVDISFADRFSFAIIDTKSILALDENELSRLANDFYNDTYLMDQNACSSPKLILWLGESESAKERFWQAVAGLASQKYDLADIKALEKYNALCAKAITNDEIISFKHEQNLLYRVEISSVNKEFYSEKFGVFYECSLKNYDRILEFLSEKFQTITYFGIEPNGLREFLLANNARGVDRIVKIGHALEISHLWDGHDIIKELSRKIEIN